MISGSAFAQQFNDYLEVSREVLKVEKKALIAEVMQLSETESPAFWPIYNEYEQKKYDVNTKLMQVLLDFSDNYGKMSDEKAIELLSKNGNLVKRPFVVVGNTGMVGFKLDDWKDKGIRKLPPPL